MTKILKDEDLDRTLKRLLRQDLNLCDDYISAVVYPNIDFDRDKKGELIPRLNVKIFVEDIADRTRVAKLTQTSWGSLPPDHLKH